MASLAAISDRVVFDNPSFFIKTKLFIIEVLIKEFLSICEYVYYSIKYYFNSHPYGLDRPLPAGASKIVILIHGQGSNPSCFLPLVKRMHVAGINHIFTFRYSEKEEIGKLPRLLESRIREIAQNQPLEVALIGHSLGGSIAFRLAYQDGQGELQKQGICISQVISIAGRLRFIPNPWSWYCPGLAKELEFATGDYARNKDQVDLFTISGSQDVMVPKESVHVGKNQFEAERCRHLGTIFASEVHDKVAEVVQNWSNADKKQRFKCA